MIGLSLSESEVKQITNRIMSCKLTETSHLFLRYPDKTIGEAALMFSPEYSQEAKERPGLVLLSVILAAHRNYTKQVEPQLNRIRKLPFSSFKDLRNELTSVNRFVNFCGMDEEYKYHILRQLLDTIDKLKAKTGIHDDYSIMNHWAQKADYMNVKSDVIGRIPGIGIATFQHLRMNFGIDTVKPDQRVTEVLNREYSFKSVNPVECIAAVESIAKIVGLRAIELDQILVNYGSGYYAKEGMVERKKLMTGSGNDIRRNKKREITNVIGAKELNQLPKNSWYTPAEFAQKVYSYFNGDESVFNMLSYILNNIITCRLDVLFEKRGDAFNIVPSILENNARDKNAATIWISNSSISIIILNEMKRKVFSNVSDIKENNVFEKIRNRYDYLIR